MGISYVNGSGSTGATGSTQGTAEGTAGTDTAAIVTNTDYKPATTGGSTSSGTRTTSNGSGATLQNNQWTTSSGNAAYHPYGEYYNDGYVRPSQQDLQADWARQSARSGGANAGTGLPDMSLYGELAPGGYYGGGSSKPADPRTIDDKWNDAIQPDPEGTKALYNGDAAAAANAELMRNAGIDLNGNVKVGRVNNIDTIQEENMLKQITDAQRQQAILNADNTVNNGIRDMQRNMEDTQPLFQTTRDQIDIDEQRALDNQALYSEARGDRGGIGQAQYNTIQNTAATNRLTVQKEQNKLATDTARQITDLRAQGEFEKANQLLSITQNYLSELMDLYTWAKEANIGIDEFNIQVDEWEENYKLSLINAQIDVANATGVFNNGTPTFATWAKTQEMLAAAGQAMMAQGLAPTVEQLQAMGWTKDQMIDFYSTHYPNGPRDKTYAEKDADGNYTGNIINARTGEVVTGGGSGGGYYGGGYGGGYYGAAGTTGDNYEYLNHYTYGAAANSAMPDSRKNAWEQALRNTARTYSGSSSTSPTGSITTHTPTQSTYTRRDPTQGSAATTQTNSARGIAQQYQLKS